MTIAEVEALIAEKIVDICCLGTWVADIYVTSLEKWQENIICQVLHSRNHSNICGIKEYGLTYNFMDGSRKFLTLQKIIHKPLSWKLVQSHVSTNCNIFCCSCLNLHVQTGFKHISARAKKKVLHSKIKFCWEILIWSTGKLNQTHQCYAVVSIA